VVSPNFIKLNIDFDPQRLQEDLKRAEESFKKITVIGPYNDGSWSGIALRSNDGTAEDIEAYNQGDSKNTPVLENCPYFKEVLNQLGFSSGVVRLLFLPPGKIIGDHKDKNSWRNGYVRLHLPIVTNEDVTMIIDGERKYMAPGELWFGDFGRTHSVENRSHITRVHMVLDSYVNEGLLALLPKEDRDALLADEDVLIVPEAIESANDNLEKYTGFYKSKVGLLSILGKVTTNNNRLYLAILGFPYNFAYHPTAKNHFRHMSNVLQIKEDDTGDAALYFSAEGSNQPEVKISLYESLSFFDRLQWGFQALVVKFGFFVFHSYSFVMKYFFKFFKKLKN
jgi:hypothetical protein